MLKNKFLLYPILLFGILFSLDKIFLIEELKKLIKTDFTHIYYETRETLIDSIAKDEELKSGKKKFMLILGSSRLLYFDAKELKEYYPEWVIYNLSSAVTTPAYYDYFLRRVLSTGRIPDLVLLETDPNQFNENSPVFKSSNLTYSFNLSYVLENAVLFGKDNVSFFLGKQLFASSKNKPHLDTAWKRYNDPNFSTISAMQDVTKNFLITNRGHSLPIVESYVERDFSSLEATSKRTMDWVYASFKLSKMQFEFYEKLLTELQKNKIPTLIVIPQTSIPMQKMLLESSFYPSWKKEILAKTKNHGYSILDMMNSSEYYCNAFVDGGHMAKDCYHPFMRFVMMERFRLEKKEPSPNELR
ncbi:MAG: DUF1574 domain-containing protein [Leptospiraceae bacterium]|nr:DUF1574 domain-containing protein [Leptospiraceae bacterium]